MTPRRPALVKYTEHFTSSWNIWLQVGRSLDRSAVLIHIAELDCKHVLPGNGWATCTIPAEWLGNEVQQVGRHVTIQATVASSPTATRVIALLNQDLHMSVQKTTVKQSTDAVIITISHYTWCDRGSTHAYAVTCMPPLPLCNLWYF